MKFLGSLESINRDDLERSGERWIWRCFVLKKQGDEPREALGVMRGDHQAILDFHGLSALVKDGARRAPQLLEIEIVPRERTRPLNGAVRDHIRIEVSSLGIARAPFTHRGV